MTIGSGGGHPDLRSPLSQVSRVESAPIEPFDRLRAGSGDPHLCRRALKPKEGLNGAPGSITSFQLPRLLQEISDSEIGWKSRGCISVLSRSDIAPMCRKYPLGSYCQVGKYSQGRLHY